MTPIKEKVMKWLSIVGSLFTNLLSLLTPEIAKEALDAAFDVIEDKVEGSKNKIDDTIVLPVLLKLRQLLDIPDNDEK
jgi:hypothetical protein